MKISLTRQIKFKASHSYRLPNLSECQNQKLFGPTVKKHSHIYIVEVSVEGILSNKSKMIMDLSQLDQILLDVSEIFDGKYINQTIPYFKSHLPTTEALAEYIFKLINKKLKVLKKTNKITSTSISMNGHLKSIRVYESPNLFAEASK